MCFEAGMQSSHYDEEMPVTVVEKYLEKTILNI